MDGQFKVNSGILFEVNFGSFRMRFPSSAWKDSRVERSVEFNIHDSEPYMRTGRIQHSTKLRDERGLSKPWKAPSWPCEKKAARAF